MCPKGLRRADDVGAGGIRLVTQGERVLARSTKTPLLISALTNFVAVRKSG